ncbi:thymidine phosphorylase [Spirochaeta cellobiosiphila]|uniref:thymidine phosphorylase n=1 Tax=Spirochaeta cellobiosiphila TaxID=504483 RepID=UPI00041F357C|nr:thymidine phosphorylase [Spirochaeta cellobiosiphila]
MRAVEIIMKKRDGKALSEEELRFLIEGYVSGDIPEYQVSAWLMAVYFKGMTPEETGYLTKLMIESGDVFDLSGIEGPFVDKHSTGGVGDKVSLILAPLAASCGLKVPMMSGRALGHTGGTLDKLDSIEGYSTALSEDQIRKGLTETGMIMTGQSKKVVPADRLMYALRDVTGTVESIPLITASIMSKKFAEGAQSLIFDVKCGQGAFMKDFDSAKALAESLVNTGKSLGRNVVAVLTRMEEPLGVMTGNFLEVEESIKCLKGEGPKDLMDVTYRLTAWMLVAGAVCENVKEAEALCRQNISNGKALDKFYENVAFQGGDVEQLKKDYEQRRSSYSLVVESPVSGYISGINALEAGLGASGLGAGRNKTTDPVLFNVGYEFVRKTGDLVKTGEPLCVVYAEDQEKLKHGAERILSAYSFSDNEIQQEGMILAEIASI